MRMLSSNPRGVNFKIPARVGAHVQALTWRRTSDLIVQQLMQNTVLSSLSAHAILH